MDNLCPLCLDENPEVISIFQCSHKICYKCISGFLFLYDFPKKCPICRETVYIILIARSSEANQEDFLAKTLKVAPKTAHLTPLGPSLMKIIALPDLEFFHLQAAVIIRRCDMNILLKEIIEIYSKCPLCNFRDLSFGYLENHIFHKHQMLRCNQCPRPSEIYPKYFTFYDEEALTEHKIIYHILPDDDCFNTYYVREVLMKNMSIVLFDKL